MGYDMFAMNVFFNLARTGQEVGGYLKTFLNKDPDFTPFYIDYQLDIPFPQSKGIYPYLIFKFRHFSSTIT